MNKYILKDLLEIKNGKDHKHLSDGSIPVYGSGGVMRYANNSIYDDESILLPRKGTLNNIQYVNKPFWTVDTIYYTIVNKEKANPYYLYNYLRLLDLSTLNSGTGVPSMTFGAYYDVEVKLPDLTTQTQIAKVLSDLDAKIELNNKINAELEAMAKLIYDYWFVQFDFPISKEQAKSMGKPELEGKPYKSSGGKMVWNEELKREVPAGWEIKLLGDYAQIKKGKLITNKTANAKGNVKVISAGIDYSYFHDESNYPENTITISASGASAGFINFWREPIFASDCTTVRGFSDADTIHVLGFLRMRQAYIYQQARGSAQPHVYPKDIEVLKIAVPPKELINQYGNLITSGNSKISNNLKENQKLAELRDWLLPMLMNGQVKVSSQEETLNMAAESEVKYGNEYEFNSKTGR